LELWEELMEFHRGRDAWRETREDARPSMQDWVLRGLDSLRRIEVCAACYNEVSTRFRRKMGFTPTTERLFAEPSELRRRAPGVQEDDDQSGLRMYTD